MPIQHINRKGDTYYLHEGLTKTGKPKYHFSKKTSAEQRETVPEGFEVYENPHGQVFCRRQQKRHITDSEIETVEAALRAHQKDDFTLVDVKGKDIIVWESNARELAETAAKLSREFGFGRIAPSLNLQSSIQYHELLKFTLIDPEDRLFSSYRWSWRGSIDDWMPLMGVSSTLPELIQELAPHIGEESFFELM